MLNPSDMLIYRFALRHRDPRRMVFGIQNFVDMFLSQIVDPRNDHVTPSSSRRKVFEFPLGKLELDSRCFCVNW